ncbi:MAG: copper chaperone PCu(A)C [Thermomicrobiales bacterium]|nr:copper chaperone PCu(A)C [Thermomicrobiales bacterium]
MSCRLPIALATLLVLSVVIATAAASAPTAATPHPPLATPADYGGFEMPGAVPISLVIVNHGEVDDWLLGGSTPLGDQVVTHQSRVIDGRRLMEPAPDGIRIPAGATRILEPAVDHLMLLGLRANLVQGESFPLTLRFAHAGEVEVPVRVRRKVDAAGLTPPPPVEADDLTISLASAPPAPVAHIPS